LYKFKVTASNILGEGVPSDEFTVFVSDMPEMMQPVVTSIFETRVIIDWDKPDENYDNILSYEVQFVASDGSLVYLHPQCDGADPTVTHCEIEMSDLIAGTGL
jgi:hypothetical protein